ASSDPLTAIQQRTLQLMADEADMALVLGALCDGVDALDPDVISTIMLADVDGERLWLRAGRRVPEGLPQKIGPLPIAPRMGSCGTAAFRKESVISADIASDPLWSGPAEECRVAALSHGLRAAWSVPLLSKTKQTLGTFALYYTEARRPTVDDVHLIEKASQIALIAIEHDRSKTALKDAFVQIEKSEAELKTIVNMIPQIVIVLAPDGTTQFVNQLALDYTGFSANEATGPDFRRRTVHPEDVERLNEPTASALARGLPFENEQRVKHFSGAHRWFLIHYSPLRDDQGTVSRWYCTATDIHDRKQAEERTQNENLALRDEVEQTSMFDEIVGASNSLRAVLSRIAKVAPTDSTVLITGETGTGKELIARAIHRKSQRASRAFVSVNCAAIPRDLILSELFGHEKGAFTGATQRRLGRFELADGGTIFLDEVGELLPDTQVALLRVLQEREFERVG